MEFLIAIAACIAFPLIIGYAYGRNQEPPLIDPDFYAQFNDE
jgi:hypothetical protein